MVLEEVKTYHVVIERRKTFHYPRQIYLETINGAGLQIYFTDEEGDDLGSVAPSSSTVQVYLPLRDFDDIHQLLRTEKEVRASWQMDVSQKLISFSIETKKDLVPGG